jgi:hypothetical protein
LQDNEGGSPERADLSGDELLERLYHAEHTASSFNKLDFEEIVCKIEALASRMRFHLQNIEHEWPDFSCAAAEIRGYSFLTFLLTHHLAIKELYREGRPLRPPRNAVTLDSLA